MSSSNSEPSDSDTEEHVVDESETVIINFICVAYRQLANEDVPDNFTPDTTRYIDYWEGKTLIRCSCYLFASDIYACAYICACIM